jgi:hypothetical protein
MDPKFATSFAPYTPPPDEPSALPPQSTPQSTPAKVAARASAWLQAPSSTPATYANSTPNRVASANPHSYQAGGLPTLGHGPGAGITGFGGGAGAREEEGIANLWETRFGWRVDVLSAVAYLGGPVSGVSLLLHDDPLVKY